ncbi:molecular chaperone DnaK [Desulfurispira natronophila]|uniref:Molecular chaperone DnaK n=1 Tax=Desulfurispira natronophila TaxID=682562 RepID=A0A7W7Y3U4_9BACT|nr:molecular chaperone DnaK [Desulfurispira natronophila]MBB5021429.1 molecular chaperone DnaK [Desulfurispira natronophila]
MSTILGIDFGTTNSVIAIVDGAKPVVIPNRSGEHLTPSTVAFQKDGNVLIGRTAKNQAVINSERTFLSIKRHMGTRFTAQIDGIRYRPEMIGAMIIRQLRQDAEEHLSKPISRAVITVPAYFSDQQRQSVKDAGELAGLEVVRIINEPTAAALAYGIDREVQETIAVFDLGGGTYDISILEVCDGVVEVLATSGNNYFGGDDFDNALIQHIADEFQQLHNIDLTEDKMALQKLREDAEKAKIMLSEVSEVSINIPFITADNTGPKHLETTITRQQFESLIESMIDQLTQPAQKALDDAGLQPSDLDRVLLVGGTTRVPRVQQIIEDFTGKSVSKSVNPVECVAAGAAVQAAIIEGDVRDLILVDITPLTLGIETEGNRFIPIIRRNTALPCSNSKVFTTISDNQSVVEVHILQGESEWAADNISLGKFQLTGIRMAPKGEPRIEVTFNIDVNGIVSVSAIDLDTRNRHEINIKDFNRLSETQMRTQVRFIEKKVQGSAQ